jgi:hypothetical protein
VPAIQVMIRRAFVSYMTKFDRASLRFFTELLRIYEREEQQKHDAGLKEAIEYKNYWENVLRERKRKGITGDDPIPHPDNVIIDFESGDFRIRGPMTKEERDEFVAARWFGRNWLRKASPLNRLPALDHAQRRMLRNRARQPPRGHPPMKSTGRPSGKFLGRKGRRGRLAT